jgi:hypothetical protein
VQTDVTTNEGKGKQVVLLCTAVAVSMFFTLLMGLGLLLVTRTSNSQAPVDPDRGVRQQSSTDHAGTLPPIPATDNKPGRSPKVVDPLPPPPSLRRNLVGVWEVGSGTKETLDSQLGQMWTSTTELYAGGKYRQWLQMNTVLGPTKSLAGAGRWTCDGKILMLDNQFGPIRGRTQYSLEWLDDDQFIAQAGLFQQSTWKRK